MYRVRENRSSKLNSCENNDSLFKAGLISLLCSVIVLLASHLLSLNSRSEDRNDKYLSMAIEKRLEVAQDIYSLCMEYRSKIRFHKDRVKIGERIRDHLNESIFYLDSESRQKLLSLALVIKNIDERKIIDGIEFEDPDKVKNYYHKEIFGKSSDLIDQLLDSFHLSPIPRDSFNRLL